MDGLAETITQLLDEIHVALVERARAFRNSRTTATTSYEEFKSVMAGRPGFVQAPWCGSEKCEADIKAETQATIRNIPFGFEQAPDAPCIRCGQPATVTAWFAKAY